MGCGQVMEGETAYRCPSTSVLFTRIETMTICAKHCEVIARALEIAITVSRLNTLCLIIKMIVAEVSVTTTVIEEVAIAD